MLGEWLGYSYTRKVKPSYTLRFAKRISFSMVKEFIFLNSLLFAQWSFSTDYFKIGINTKGYVVSMQNVLSEPHREFSSKQKPSPLLSLYDGVQKRYYQPIRAKYNKTQKQFTLSYPNGSQAQIQMQPQKNTLR